MTNKMQKEANHIAKTIGKFSIYKGMHKQKINDQEGPAFLAKQILAHCQPHDDWETSSLTRLQRPLHRQHNKYIAVTTKGNAAAVKSLGLGRVQISLDTLKSLANSAQITTQQNLVPKELFLAIQKKIFHHIQEQEQRTLKELLDEANLYLHWRRKWQKLGFKSQQAFDKTANTSMLILASGICLAGNIHFLVEQHKDRGIAYNKIRNANLNDKTHTLLLSIPGLNLRYGVDIKQEDQFDLIMQMWDCVLASAKQKNIEFLCIPAIGLGAFSGSNPSQAASFYFKGLMKLLSTKYKNDFKGIYYNICSSKKPHGFVDEFQDAMNVYGKHLGETQIQAFEGDVKFLAIELAKHNIPCALVNPSDADVVWGVRDVGEYYKIPGSSYAAEEDIAATSTAALLSREISWVYTNARKIHTCHLSSELKIVAHRSSRMALLGTAAVTLSLTFLCTTTPLAFVSANMLLLPLILGAVLSYQSKRQADVLLQNTDVQQVMALGNNDELLAKLSASEHKNAFDLGQQVQASYQKGFFRGFCQSAKSVFNSQTYCPEYYLGIEKEKNRLGK